MGNLLTATEMKVHINTDLTDIALDQLIAEANEEIVDAVGEHASVGTVTELLIGGEHVIFPDRVIGSITSITETRGTVDTVLAVDDFRVWNNRSIERLALAATNPQRWWAERVSVVYTPENDDARRIGATISLVKLSISFSGKSSERAGDYAESTSGVMLQERGRILRRLSRKSLIPG